VSARLPHWRRPITLEAKPSRAAPYAIQIFLHDGVARLPLFTNRPFSILAGEARYWKSSGPHERPERVEIRWGDLVWEWRP